MTHEQEFAHAALAAVLWLGVAWKSRRWIYEKCCAGLAWLGFKEEVHEYDAR
ncbi:hypothetical protein [Leucobacter sp. 1207-22]|uniref:hypothetical protein n=1 Tax=Leucobacter sp. 1207-22 TaxID=2604456 RepID=UPI004063217C